MQDLEKFIPRVVNQLGANLKQLQQLGATKVVVTSLEPLGCLPRTTVESSYQQCNTTQNVAVNYHNLLLQQAVAKLNNDSKCDTFFIIDLYASFTAVLAQKGDYQGIYLVRSFIIHKTNYIIYEFGLKSIDIWIREFEI